MFYLIKFETYLNLLIVFYIYCEWKSNVNILWLFIFKTPPHHHLHPVPSPGQAQDRLAVSDIKNISDINLQKFIAHPRTTWWLSYCWLKTWSFNSLQISKFVDQINLATRKCSRICLQSCWRQKSCAIWNKIVESFPLGLFEYIITCPKALMTA